MNLIARKIRAGAALRSHRRARLNLPHAVTNDGEKDALVGRQHAAVAAEPAESNDDIRARGRHLNDLGRIEPCLKPGALTSGLRSRLEVGRRARDLDAAIGDAHVRIVNRAREAS